MRRCGGRGKVMVRPGSRTVGLGFGGPSWVCKPSAMELSSVKVILAAAHGIAMFRLAEQYNVRHSPILPRTVGTLWYVRLVA